MFSWSCVFLCEQCSPAINRMKDTLVMVHGSLGTILSALVAFNPSFFSDSLKLSPTVWVTWVGSGAGTTSSSMAKKMSVTCCECYLLLECIFIPTTEDSLADLLVLTTSVCPHSDVFALWQVVTSWDKLCCDKLWQDKLGQVVTAWCQCTSEQIRTTNPHTSLTLFTLQSISSSTGLNFYKIWICSL